MQSKADESGRRALRIGDAFQDGWSLSALTPSTATLTKAGESRVVGLNPTGAVTTPDVKRPSLVQVAGSELPPTFTDPRPFICASFCAKIDDAKSYSFGLGTTTNHLDALVSGLETILARP